MVDGDAAGEEGGEVEEGGGGVGQRGSMPRLTKRVKWAQFWACGLYGLDQAYFFGFGIGFCY